MAYAYKGYNKERMARGIGMSLPISTKQSIEVCSLIRGKKVENAKKMLSEVVDGKKAVPFRRFNKDMGHKTKIGPGRFPIKCAKEILQMIESVEMNAQFKGLNTSSLVIRSIIPNKASANWHYGRARKRAMKRTNLEVVLEEIAAEKRKKKAEPKGKDKTNQERPKETGKK